MNDAHDPSGRLRARPVGSGIPWPITRAATAPLHASATGRLRAGTGRPKG